MCRRLVDEGQFVSSSFCPRLGALLLDKFPRNLNESIWQWMTKMQACYGQKFLQVVWLEYVLHDLWVEQGNVRQMKLEGIGVVIEWVRG